FAAPFEALAALARTATAARAAVSAELADWDARYHDDGGVLACLADLEATPANLESWVRDAAEPQVIRPVRALLALAAPLAAAVAPILGQAQALATDIDGKIAAILTGPGSVGAITGAI